MALTFATLGVLEKHRMQHVSMLSWTHACKTMSERNHRRNQIQKILKIQIHLQSVAYQLCTGLPARACQRHADSTSREHNSSSASFVPTVSFHLTSHCLNEHLKLW
jgi:hypothetical protein